MLGDVLRRRKDRIRCYLTVLNVAPRHAEAHAELSLVYAQMKDPQYGPHAEQALANCRGNLIEDDILQTALDAAEIMGDRELANRARKLGRRRFPTSALFRAG